MFVLTLAIFRCIQRDLTKASILDNKNMREKFRQKTDKHLILLHSLTAFFANDIFLQVRLNLIEIAGLKKLSRFDREMTSEMLSVLNVSDKTLLNNTNKFK